MALKKDHEIDPSEEVTQTDINIRDIFPEGNPTKRPQIVEAHSTCPQCERRLPVATYFGWRRWNGQIYPQSWCRDCRQAHYQATYVGKRQA